MKAKIYKGTARNLALLAARLRAGDLVAVPTETVYGLAANALSARACRKIFTAKGRPASDPLIVHLRAAGDMSRVAEVNSAAIRLAEKFWPGPLTLVLPKKAVVPDVVSAGRPSVAVRVPSHPLFRRLIRLAGIPLAAPSANPFGYLSPTTAGHVRSGLGGRIRHILDGGASRVGVESTIVDLRDPRRPRLLRPGRISLGEIERALGIAVGRSTRRRGSPDLPQLAPGQLARHYSPRTPLVLHRRISPGVVRQGPASEAWLLIRRPAASARRKNVYFLDEKGSLPGVARRLFSTLRRIDEAGYARIHAELAAGGGLAEAINDRLRRAASR